MSEQAEKRIYLVLAADGDIFSALRERFKDTLSLGDNTVLVRTDSLADDVASEIGIWPENDKSGVVLKMSQTYAGDFDSGLWDWLG